MAIQLELVVDANPLISALLGGRALEILFNPLFRCVTTERTTWEVKRYIPMIADRSGVPEAEVLSLFEMFPLTAIQSSFYQEQVDRATQRIGERDAKDVDVLALTYKLRAPLWTADHDLRDVDDIETVTTNQLEQIV